jgi:hypothetical protein
MLANPIIKSDDNNTDLVINNDSITTPQTQAKPKSTINFTAYVRNDGNEDVANVTAQIWLVSPEAWLSPKLLRKLTFDVKARSLHEIHEMVTLGNWGDYDIIIKINPDFNVFESDYTNNVAHRTIQISAELGISALLIYPNPVFISKNPEVNIRYGLSQDAYVTVSIYDLTGNLIYDEKFNPGENGGQRGPNNNIKWNVNSSKPIAPGIYVCQTTVINSNGEQRSISGKLALIR